MDVDSDALLLLQDPNRKCRGGSRSFRWSGGAPTRN
jgi:hypothetical protein